MAEQKMPTRLMVHVHIPKGPGTFTTPTSCIVVHIPATSPYGSQVNLLATTAAAQACAKMYGSTHRISHCCACWRAHVHHSLRTSNTRPRYCRA